VTAPLGEDHKTYRFWRNKRRDCRKSRATAAPPNGIMRKPVKTPLPILSA